MQEENPPKPTLEEIINVCNENDLIKNYITLTPVNDDDKLIFYFRSFRKLNTQEGFDAWTKIVRLIGHYTNIIGKGNDNAQVEIVGLDYKFHHINWKELKDKLRQIDKQIIDEDKIIEEFFYYM